MPVRHRGGLLLIAAIAVIVPYPEDARGAVHLERKLRSPSAAHWFGTDEVGNDVYTRVVLGARVSLQIGVIITGVAALLGVPLGIVAGHVRGRTGEVIMRVTDVFLSVPALVLALAVVGALGPGIVNAMIALSLVWWPGYVRLVRPRRSRSGRRRSSSRARRRRRSVRIVLAHLLPNCVSPIVVKASMDMAPPSWPPPVSASSAWARSRRIPSGGR